MSIVLARSGFGASLWPGLPAAVLGAVGVVMAASGIVKLERSFRDYRSEVATLPQFDRRASCAVALRFVGLQLFAIGVLLALAALVALVLPGMAVQAAFVSVFLTAAIWAVRSLVRAGQSVGATLEQLVGRRVQIELAQRLVFWRLPYVVWTLAGRVANARQASVSDTMSRSYLNALDSDGVVRPNLRCAGPSVAVDARLRFLSLLPVFLIALPFAAIAWAAAAWLPDNLVPRLPSPVALLGLESPLAPLDDVTPPPDQDQDAPAAEEGEGSVSDGQGNSGAGTKEKAGEDRSSSDGGVSGPQAVEGQRGSSRGGSGEDQSGASDQGSSEPEGGVAAPEGRGAQIEASTDAGSGAGVNSTNNSVSFEGAGQAEAGLGVQVENETTPRVTGDERPGGDGGGSPSLSPARDQVESGADESDTEGGEVGPAEAPNAQQPNPAAQIDGTSTNPADAGTALTEASPQGPQPVDSQSPPPNSENLAGASDNVGGGGAKRHPRDLVGRRARPVWGRRLLRTLKP